MFDLHGKIALVTGAGRGMGCGIARCLGRQGAALLINDFFPERAENAVAELRAGGIRAEAAQGDVTNPGDRARLFELAHASLGGGIDILVNNAGVNAQGMPLKKMEELDEGEYRKQIEINHLGVIAMVKLALPHMREKGWGRIVNITSESWRLPLDFGLTHYASAKAAMVGFTRVASRELGPHGITVNAISLGTMDNWDDFKGIAARSTSVGRAGSADDVGALAVYLASNEASWITGQVIALNGGSLVA
jgi:NAD(P)-dependent dehydrogenase (short-subunit alcohol dehydrogenase family)